MGNITKLTDKVTDKVCELLASGDYTIYDLCKKAGIGKTSYYDWAKDNSDFAERIKKAKEQRLEAFKDMARSGLATLLTERETFEETIEYVQDPKDPSKLVVKSKKVSKKILAPNPTSVIYALSNTDPDNFKNYSHVDHTTKGKSITSDFSNLTTEELVDRVKALKTLKDAE